MAVVQSIGWLLVIVTRLHTCFCLVCIFSVSSSLTCTHPLPLPLPSAGSWLSHLSSHFYLSPLQSCTRCPESRGSFWMFYFTCGLKRGLKTFNLAQILILWFRKNHRRAEEDRVRPASGRRMSRAEEREEADCVCSVGMKLTWDINDPKLPQVPRDPSHPLLILNVINKKKDWEEIKRKLKLDRK